MKIAMKLYGFRTVFWAMILLLLVSCANDDVNPDNPIVEQREGTCFDGIRNGEEVIVDCGGECPGFCPPSSLGILGGEVKATDPDEVGPGRARVDGLRLDPKVEYRLIGPLLIRDEARLSIPAGTVIKADPNVGAYIAVAQGGTLLVSGQPDNPVVITSGAENPAPGDWGGIIICGEGPIVSGDVGRTDIIDIFYGGSDLMNSSGGINYLRVEYAGAIAETGQNFDAISFYGVGAFTNITNIQTFESLGNGIRFIGGNADAEQLVATNSSGNSVVVQDDWSGKGDSWYLNGIAASGIKFTSNLDIGTNVPVVSDTIGNVSIIGPVSEGGLNYARGGGKYNLSNIFNANLSLAINVSDETASEQIDMGNLKIDSIEFDGPVADFVPSNYTGDNTDFYTEGTTLGAGNKALAPDWTIGWTTGLQ